MPSPNSIIRTSGENVIDVIKEHRDDLIERLCNIKFLRSYLLQEFKISDLSEVKLEFIKRALLELKATSIDLTHYAALILETRRKDSLTISKNTEQDFQKDIERTIKNYL